MEYGLALSVTLLRPERGAADVGRPSDFGFEHVDDTRQRFLLGVVALARVGTRGMARDVDEKQTPHVRLFERARECDGKSAIDDERAQHFRGIIAAHDVRRQWLLLGTGPGSPVTNGCGGRHTPSSPSA